MATISLKSPSSAVRVARLSAADKVFDILPALKDWDSLYRGLMSGTGSEL
jgi:hypothetical protein